MLLVAECHLFDCNNCTTIFFESKVYPSIRSGANQITSSPRYMRISGIIPAPTKHVGFSRSRQ